MSLVIWIVLAKSSKVFLISLRPGIMSLGGGAELSGSEVCWGAAWSSETVSVIASGEGVGACNSLKRAKAILLEFMSCVEAEDALLVEGIEHRASEKLFDKGSTLEGEEGGRNESRRFKVFIFNV